MTRYPYLLALLLAAAPAAFAQSPGTLPHAPTGHATFRTRFEAANTTNDGKLTLDQARAANMRNIVRHFTEMDAGGKGYVTLQDMRAWRQAQHAAKATQPVAPPPQ